MDTYIHKSITSDTKSIVCKCYRKSPYYSYFSNVIIVTANLLLNHPNKAKKIQLQFTTNLQKNFNKDVVASSCL